MEEAVCAACSLHIRDRFMLRALGKLWHEDCLKCTCCHCRLGELGSKLYYKQSMILCARDYLRLFGLTGVCAACDKNIPAFELVMRAKSNVYHLQCFACQICNHRFCIGDKYYLCDNKILCQYDYEERMTFLQAAYNNQSFTEITKNLQQLEDFEPHLLLENWDRRKRVRSLTELKPGMKESLIQYFRNKKVNKRFKSRHTRPLSLC